MPALKPVQTLTTATHCKVLLLSAKRMPQSVSPNYTTDREVREIGEDRWHINQAKMLISDRRTRRTCLTTEVTCILTGLFTNYGHNALGGMLGGGLFGLIPSAVAALIALNWRISVDALKKEIKEMK